MAASYQNLRLPAELLLPAKLSETVVINKARPHSRPQGHPFRG